MGFGTAFDIIELSSLFPVLITIDPLPAPRYSKYCGDLLVDVEPDVLFYDLKGVRETGGFSTGIVHAFASLNDRPRFSSRDHDARYSSYVRRVGSTRFSENFNNS